MNEMTEDIVSRDNNIDVRIYNIINEAYHEFEQIYGERHSSHIKEMIESITDKIRETILYYEGPTAAANPKMGVIYSISPDLSAVLKHEMWHVYNNGGSDIKVSLTHIPIRYIEHLERSGYLQKQYSQKMEYYKSEFKDEPKRLESLLVGFEEFKNDRFDFGDSQIEMWTEWFSSQTHLKDMKNNFWDWGDGYFTKSYASGSFYDSYIKIASMISCIIPKEKLLDMYLNTSEYYTGYSYPEMLEDFDNEYADALEQEEKEKYRYPYLKIIMEVETIDENARKNPLVARRALQSCMKTCFNAYLQKLDRIQDIDIERAKSLYAEIKYMQENMLWNIDISKLQNLDYIQALNKVQDRFKSILQDLGLDNPEVQKMFESIEYTSENPFEKIEDGEEISEKIATIPKEDKESYATIGDYRTKVGKSGIKGNLYNSLFILLGKEKFNLLFENFQNATSFNNGENILLEIHRQIEKAETDEDVTSIYNRIYELYIQKMERTLKTTENIAYLFDRYSNEIVGLQKNAMFKDGKYPPKLEEIISLYTEKAQMYEQEVNRCTELDIKNRIEQGMPEERANLYAERFASRYKSKLREQLGRITIQRDAQILEYTEFNQRNNNENLGSIEGDTYLIHASQIGKATINVPTTEKKQAEEMLYNEIARENDGKEEK